MDIALFQPEIPQNTAAILRTAACFNAGVHIIGPAAFDLSQRAMRRAGLDYASTARIERHADWNAFAGTVNARWVLFTTQGVVRMDRFSFRENDILLFGQESAGVPSYVRDACPDTVRIPISGEARSLNLAVSVGIGLALALSAAQAFDSKGLR